MTSDERADNRTPARRGSDRPALVIAAIALAAVVALSALVGFAGAHNERFSWELASIFGTALGTTLLAAATGWLAWSTRSEVRATQDLAELTRRQQTASERPVVLLKQNPTFRGSPDNGEVTFDLQNVGLGPALRVNVSVVYTGHADWQPGIDSVTIPVIMPGTGVTPNLAVRFPQPPTPREVEGTAFLFTGDYLDRSMLNKYEILTTWPSPELER